MRDKIVATVNSMFNYDFGEQEAKMLQDMLNYFQTLTKSEEVLQVIDHSTGVAPEIFIGDPSVKRDEEHGVKLSWLTQVASAPPQMCLMLYRLVKITQAQNVLEFGTCIGMASCFIAAGLRHTLGQKLITVEGDKTLADRAQQHINHFGLSEHTKIYQELFDKWLDMMEAGPLVRFDMVYLDGNHNGEATLKYWKRLKPLCNPGCLFVFDDINWTGMREAWRQIIGDKSVEWSIGDETRHRFGILRLEE